MVGRDGVAHHLTRSGGQGRRSPRPPPEPIARKPSPPSRCLPDGRHRTQEDQELGSLGSANWPGPLEPLPDHWMTRSARKPGPGSFPGPRRSGSHGVGQGARPARRLAPGRGSYPCSTGRRPVDRIPRSGRVEIRLGPAWVRYRGTATPETDPPSVVHRPVLIRGRHRARLSRPRVNLPRCRPSSWRPPAAMPTAPMPPRLPLPALRAYVAVPTRPGVCPGSLACAPHEPAVLHRVAQ